MPPKSNGKITKNKKDETNKLVREYTKDSSIFETTYEKVLSIINKVKDFIKKTSKTSQKLIDDLEWVIKVITNKSLYSYGVNKEKMTKQTSDYNKFINFVTKYNEEVLELNKRHILVSLFTIGKKGDILLKPSLCLTKILPEELKNMDYQKEKEKKQKKKNSINQIGNIILNLYYRGLERQKKEKEEEKQKLEKSEKSFEKINKNDKKDNIMEKIEKLDKKDNKTDKKINIEKNDKIDKYCKIQNYLRKDVKDKIHFIQNGNYISVSNPKIKKIKKNNTSKNNLSRISINESDKKRSIEIRNRIKNRMLDDNVYSNKKENNNSQISLHKKLTLTSIKKAMEDYYISQINLIENKNKIKGKSKSQYFINELLLDKKRSNSLYSHSSNKGQMNKNKELMLEINNRSHIQINNYKTKKIKINKKEERPPLKTLIDKYFNDMRKIIDKDFNIFEFKKLVGYKNVLPLMCHVILKTLGLLEPNIVSLSKIESFLYSVSDNYKETTLYHNSLHGADVTQSLCTYFINANVEEICETTVLDLLGIIISAMGHDLGHPGYNNNFHVNACTDLALTYNDSSCLENYHTSLLFRILKEDENNIFEKLSAQNYKTIRKRIISQILATDMANHGEVISLIKAKIKTCEEEGQKRFNLLSGNEKAKYDEQQILLNYLIHAADLGHNTKKFEISIQWVELLSNEFWMQGDMERKKGIQISFLCDRNKIDVPISQVGFLKGFIITTFDCLVNMFPSLKYTIDNTANNINEWQNLLDQHRVRGWTPKKENNNEKKEKIDQKKE